MKRLVLRGTSNPWEPAFIDGQQVDDLEIFEISQNHYNDCDAGFYFWYRKPGQNPTCDLVGPFKTAGTARKAATPVPDFDNAGQYAGAK